MTNSCRKTSILQRASFPNLHCSYPCFCLLHMLTQSLSLSSQAKRPSFQEKINSFHSVSLNRLSDSRGSKLAMRGLLLAIKSCMLDRSKYCEGRLVVMKGKMMTSLFLWPSSIQVGSLVFGEKTLQSRFRSKVALFVGFFLPIFDTSRSKMTRRSQWRRSD